MDVAWISDLHCPKCSKSFRDPRVLPCFHTVCSACIQPQQLKGGNKPLTTCPLCETSHRLAENGIDGFERNQYIDILRGAQCDNTPTAPNYCERCDRKDLIVEKHCIDCSEWLCTQCCEDHLHVRKTKTHTLATLDEIKSSKFASLLRRNQLENCTNHDHYGRRYEYFCRDTTCRKLICIICLKEDHRTHDVVDVGVQSTEDKTNLQEIYYGFDELQSAMQAEKDQVKHLISELETTTQEAHQQVNDRLADIQKHLKTIADSLHEQITHNELPHSDKLNNALVNLENKQRRLLELMRVAEEVKEEGCAQDVIQLNQVLNAQLQQEQVIYSATDTTIATPHYRPGNAILEPILRDIFGNITTEETGKETPTNSIAKPQFNSLEPVLEDTLEIISTEETGTEATVDSKDEMRSSQESIDEPFFDAPSNYSREITLSPTNDVTESVSINGVVEKDQIGSVGDTEKVPNSVSHPDVLENGTDPSKLIPNGHISVQNGATRDDTTQNEPNDSDVLSFVINSSNFSGTSADNVDSNETKCTGNHSNRTDDSKVKLDVTKAQNETHNFNGDTIDGFDVETPSPQEQNATISTLKANSPQLGESGYLLSIFWWRKWARYVGYDDKTNTSSFPFPMTAPHPGPVDNSTIQQTGVLRKYLRDGKDYEIINKDTWQKLVNWYGLVKSDTEISRPVVEDHKQGKIHVYTEVYPLELALYLYGDEYNKTYSHISRGDNVDTLHTKAMEIFRIDERDSVRLWCQKSEYDFVQLMNVDQNLVEAGIKHGEIVMVEERNYDGTWPMDEESMC